MSTKVQNEIYWELEHSITFFQEEHIYVIIIWCK